MGAVTYPNPEVAAYIAEYFIPVQFNVVDQPEAIDRFNSAWTPTLIVQDPAGREYRRSLGYLDAPRFLGEMSLGRLMESVHRRDDGAAYQRATDAARRAKGDVAREPEALYFEAVAAYKVAHDPAKLKEGWERLMERFPESDWAKKSSFIRG